HLLIQLHPQQVVFVFCFFFFFLGVGGLFLCCNVLFCVGIHGVLLVCISCLLTYLFDITEIGFAAELGGVGDDFLFFGFIFPAENVLFYCFGKSWQRI